MFISKGLIRIKMFLHKAMTHLYPTFYSSYATFDLLAEISWLKIDFYFFKSEICSIKFTFSYFWAYFLSSRACQRGVRLNLTNSSMLLRECSILFCTSFSSLLASWTNAWLYASDLHRSLVKNCINSSLLAPELHDWWRWQLLDNFFFIWGQTQLQLSLINKDKSINISFRRKKIVKTIK